MEDEGDADVGAESNSSAHSGRKRNLRQTEPPQPLPRTPSADGNDGVRVRSRSHDEHMPPRPRGWSLDKIIPNRPRAITVGSVAGKHRTRPGNRNYTSLRLRPPPSLHSLLYRLTYQSSLLAGKAENNTIASTQKEGAQEQRAENEAILTLNEVLQNRNYCAAFEVWLHCNQGYENLAFHNAVEFFKSVHGNVR